MLGERSLRKPTSPWIVQFIYSRLTPHPSITKARGSVPRGMIQVGIDTRREIKNDKKKEKKKKKKKKEEKRR